MELLWETLAIRPEGDAGGLCLAMPPAGKGDVLFGLQGTQQNFGHHIPELHDCVLVSKPSISTLRGRYWDHRCFRKRAGCESNQKANYLAYRSLLRVWMQTLVV